MTGTVLQFPSVPRTSRHACLWAEYISAWLRFTSDMAHTNIENAQRIVTAFDAIAAGFEKPK